MYSVTALVPMKHHSQRVPDKNFREFAGVPLYAQILATLQEVDEIERIIVNTDSQTIKEGISERFPNIIVRDRPAQLLGDDVSMNRIIRDDIENSTGTVYLQTHSTNPLLSRKSIQRAIRAYYEQFPSKDSLFSVTRMQTRFWDKDGNPLNHDPKTLIQTQDLPPVFEENSCIYIFQRQTFLERNNRIGRNPIIFEIPPEEAVDIDNEFDFKIAEMMFNSMREQHEK